MFDSRVGFRRRWGGYGVLALLTAMLLSAPSASAKGGDEAARRQVLYESFISPCCWRENLAVHDSAEAANLRARIDQMVGEGRSDKEIKAVFVAEYGKRILSLPEGAERMWLFWTPPTILIVGLSFLIFMLRRVRKQRPAIAGTAHDIEPAPLPPGWDEF